MILGCVFGREESVEKIVDYLEVSTSRIAVSLIRKGTITILVLEILWLSVSPQGYVKFLQMKV